MASLFEAEKLYLKRNALSISKAKCQSCRPAKKWASFSKPFRNRETPVAESKHVEA